MNGPDFTQLGVAGIVCLLLTVAVVVLWNDNKELRKQARDDQQAILPALTAATSAMTEFTRAAAITLHERG